MRPIVVLGVAEVMANLRKMPPAYRSALADALYEEGIELQGLSMRLVPVKTGRLRNSAYTNPAPPHGEPVVEVGYGTDYALEVHENTRMSHPRGGQAKYLEVPFNYIRRGFQQRVTGRVEKKLKVFG